jgi:ATP-dependent helicase YprA (DUF1998 family)
MDVFEVRSKLIGDYRAFTSGFVDVREARLRDHVARQLETGSQWPDPWISLNPSFEAGGTISQLVAAGVLHPECERIFCEKQDINDPGSRVITLHCHQREAVEAARSGESYVLTTGTGSGKSLAYLIPIVDRVLREGPRRPSVKAIIVYPMNALANSQLNELEKFLRYGYGTGKEPVTFARYTGQESQEDREQILREPPDILLTNYVMLELVLTRPEERRRLIRAAKGLRFLVLDELHTYRGRQGADVAFLVRRVRDACEAPDLQCVGTSATMASRGTMADQQAAVADVATRLFGATVTPERVIGETLRRATGADEPAIDELRKAVQNGPTDPSITTLASDPLCRWIETVFGLATEAESGRLVRGKPVRVADAAATLSDLTGEPAPTCAEAIRTALLVGSRTRDPETGRPLFAFRLHQFISKGDTVYVSLEPETTRHITSQYQVTVPGHPEKLLMPLAFCRECGQEYLVVARASREGKTAYLPRRDRDASGGDEANGYLYVSSTHPWPADPMTEGRLPDTWLDDRGEVLASRRKYLPMRVSVTPNGLEAERDSGMAAAWVPSPFTFCLRCGTAYEQVRGRDFAKLATLDAEGRSSAVSVISAAIVRSLRELPKGELREDARKLLTFVDNRQDASLQAGHFNDFVQVTQLRGALYAAAVQEPEGLRHDDVAQRVVEALGLDFAAFAANPEAKYSQRDHTMRALREVVAYRLYLDLERGWRVTMPNLEQVGLLRIEYADLAEVARDEDCWAGTHEALTGAEGALREELGRMLLDELRRVLAIDVDCLTQEGFERLQNLSTQQLIAPWALPEREPKPYLGAAFARSGRPGGGRRDLALSGRSALGRYLRRPGQFPHLPGRLDVEDAQIIISDLLAVLERLGLLAVVVDPADGGPGYRLKASALIWRHGDGRRGVEEPLRRWIDPEVGARVNPFFRDLYRSLSSKLTGLHAAEHTAQVQAEDRERREEAFRDGTLPLLYCSPTMELGVDIASLNAVAMRNVPPTPANYAQRSGRAGRALEPAIVATYCATGNSHDQYYFRRSRDMVAGSVAAPRLDLSNEDLVRSHVHAIWLAETGQNLHARLTEILDMSGEQPSLELLSEVRATLFDQHAQIRAIERARLVLGALRDEFVGTSWWYDGWIEDTVTGAAHQFDRACDRWRQLYRAALGDQQAQNRIVLNQSVAARVRRDAEARRREAENQLRLLRNEDQERGMTDFYSYRYFASEGFLPGYSFPRLPLAAYVPGVRARRGNEGDYIQRPRFIAISEFGPGALLYHEGARYEVTRIQLPISPDGSGVLDTEEARRCEACGYHHLRQAGTDRCEHCGETLGATTHGLMRLQTVFSRRRERISSDEEERRRAGFELHPSYRFNDHGSRPGRLDAEVRSTDDRPLASLSYGDSATIRVMNVGRRRRKNREDLGFWLDTAKGVWLKEKDAPDAAPEDEALEDADAAPAKRKVIPYVEDRRNILVLRLAQPVSEVLATTLRYALERGLEAAFQLEDVELDSMSLPDPEGRGRMLFTESAEGGAGVLRRLQAEPDALAEAAREALRICHFDPSTGEDLGHADGADERCERGCYDCLLSFINQADHQMIDRHSVKALLVSLAASRTASAGSAGEGRRAVVARLRELCTTGLERDFLDWLAEHDLRLPADAQTLVAEAFARPDFVYRSLDGPTAVFIDGPVHEAPAVAERDREAEERLADYGWNVVRIRADESWADAVGKHKSVFGEVRGSA